MAETSRPSYTQGYDTATTSSHAARTAEVEAAFILPLLKPHYNILDIGCGPGTITLGLARRVPSGHVTGIDLSSDVLSQAESITSFQTPPLTNLTFELGNVLEGLKYADVSFDVVFCNQVLIHTPDPITALKEMKRICKPSGFVACRESDFPFRWHPYLPGLQIYNRYIYTQIMGSSPDVSSQDHPQNPPNPEEHRRGSLLHVWARKAGFALEKMVKGAGTELWATEERRRKHAERLLSRFEKGGLRERWMGLGASEEDVEAVIRDVKVWAEDVDGWFAILQGELICHV